MVKIMVIDGQGGGMGRQLICKIKQELPDAYVIAVGTNSMSTANMLKSAPDDSATGENAVIYNASKADYIVGGIGIISANSMFGEVSPAMASSIASSGACKILIPLNKCNLKVAGLMDMPMNKMIESAITIIKKEIG